MATGRSWPVSLSALFLLAGCAGQGHYGIELDAGDELDASVDSGPPVPPEPPTCTGEPDASDEPCKKIEVQATVNQCVQVTDYLLNPLSAVVGEEVNLSAFADDKENDPVSYTWTSAKGSFSKPNWPFTTYRCEEAGDQTIKLTVSDGPECFSSVEIPVACLSAP